MSNIPDDDDVLDIRVLFQRVWRGKWWILGSTLITGAVFLVIASLTSPVYRASTVLLAAGDDRNSLSNSLNSALGQLGGLASLAGISGSANSDIQEAMAVMMSRQFTESFINDFGLMPLLFPDQWDGAAKRWRGPESSWPTGAKACKLFNHKVRSINYDKKTGLVTVQMDWRDPDQAALWANSIVARLNLEMRRRATQKTDASIEYLEKESQSTSIVTTREAISRLIESQIKQRMLANVSEEYAFRVVDKAMPADQDDPVRPRTSLMLRAGLAAGLILGLFGVLLFRTDVTRPNALGARATVGR